MKDFNQVQRWDIYGVGFDSYTEFEEYKSGDWVKYEDYTELLAAYNELSFRLEGLDK